MNPQQKQGAVLLNQEVEPQRRFNLLYNDVVWEADGYQTGNLWLILMICPKCKNNLSIKSDQKSLKVSPDGLELGEPIRCSHPAEFGGICTFHVMLERPAKKDRLACVQGIDLKVDAVARDV